MSDNQPQTLKGFRDFLPKDMVIRQRVTEILREVFESFGFEPLATPSLEYQSLLLGKYGTETDRLVYTFQDQGDRKIGLPYDLTVPTARVLAQYRNEIDLPFKRYQIQRVWRSEKPQKGRYREITQCDIDIFGSESPLADAQIIAVIYFSLKKIGFEKFTIRINSRQVLYQLMEDLRLDHKCSKGSIIKTIDKIDKKEPEKINKELKKKGLSDKEIELLFNQLNSAEPDPALRQIFEYLERFGVNKEFYRFDAFLSRGLDYYTGPIFETVVSKPKIGSITGGGRYDKLINQLGGPNIPATGTTLGLDRICEIIKDLNLWPDLSLVSSRVMVTVFSKDLINKSIETTECLRKMKIKTDLYPKTNAKIDKQIKYADKKGIPFVLVIGPDEVEKNQVTLKKMKTGEQITDSLENIIKLLPHGPNS